MSAGWWPAQETSGSPAGRGCFLSLLPTCLPGGLGPDTNPSTACPGARHGLLPWEEAVGREDLRHFPTLKPSGTWGEPTRTGESRGRAERCALDMGTTVPTNFLGTCLLACLPASPVWSRPFQASWEPAHLPPVSPPRAGSDMAPCLGPWNPECQRLCQSPSHLRGWVSAKGQSHTPSPIAPLLARGPVCCWGPSRVPWGPDPETRPCSLEEPAAPPSPSLSGIALNCRRESTHCPRSSASRSYLSALSPELFLLIIPRCWWVHPAPASCGQLPGVQAHLEPGARPASALWCLHSPPPSPQCPWLCPCSGLSGASPCPEETAPTV